MDQTTLGIDQGINQQLDCFLLIHHQAHVTVNPISPGPYVRHRTDHPEKLSFLPVCNNSLGKSNMCVDGQTMMLKVVMCDISK